MKGVRFGKKSKNFFIRKNRGIALIAVLLVLSALMVLTMGFATFTAADHTVSKTYHQSIVTLYLAQAGLEYAQYLLKHNMLIFPAFQLNADGNHPYVNYNLPSQGYAYPGEASNLYQGEEHLVISQLSWGSGSANWVYQILGDNSYCGTFYVKVTEKEDDNVTPSNPAKRVLYIKSVGKIRLVPPGHDPTSTSEDFTDDNTYPVKAQRTLIMRIPYTQNDYLKLYNDETTSTPGTVPVYYKLITDGWFEKFR